MKQILYLLTHIVVSTCLANEPAKQFQELKIEKNKPADYLACLRNARPEGMGHTAGARYPMIRAVWNNEEVGVGLENQIKPNYFVVKADKVKQGKDGFWEGHYLVTEETIYYFSVQDHKNDDGIKKYADRQMREGIIDATKLKPPSKGVLVIEYDQIITNKNAGPGLENGSSLEAKQHSSSTMKKWEFMKPLAITEELNEASRQALESGVLASLEETAQVLANAPNAGPNPALQIDTFCGDVGSDFFKRKVKAIVRATTHKDEIAGAIGPGKKKPAPAVIDEPTHL